MIQIVEGRISLIDVVEEGRGYRIGSSTSSDPSQNTCVAPYRDCSMMATTVT